MKKQLLKNIIELGRFRFLAGGFFLYMMGSLLAGVKELSFSPWLFLLGYSIMMPAHLSLSYSNNYFDQEVDKYNTPVSISGGSKILIDHPELITLCKYIAVGLIVLSIVIAGVTTIFLSYSPWFFAFIIAGNLLGWFYTAPPLRFAYRGLGEIANMFNMGLFMPGIGYWMMNGSLDVFYLIFAIPFFFYGIEFMIIVETPDMEGDRIADKKTLIAAIGRKKGYILLLVSLFVASSYFLLLYYLGIVQSSINFFIIFLLSLIPLVVALHGVGQKPFQKKIATKVAVRNMMMLISFVLLINTYFILILIGIR